jgi:hypothetical protein
LTPRHPSRRIGSLHDEKEPAPQAAVVYAFDLEKD